MTDDVSDEILNELVSRFMEEVRTQSTVYMDGDDYVLQVGGRDGPPSDVRYYPAELVAKWMKTARRRQQ